MDIEIRQFKSEDKERVEEFYAQMGYESTFFFNTVGYNYNRTMRFFSEDPEENIIHWAAVMDGRMVGYVFLSQLNKKVVHLGIAVADDMKGKHLGRRLLETAREWCRENGKGGILLTTHPANIRGQMLYRRFGFEQLGISNNRGEFLFLYNMPEEKENG